jgi:hypothetical protein
MDDAKQLLADRMLGYEKNFRLVINQSNPVNVYVGLQLI